MRLNPDYSDSPELPEDPNFEDLVDKFTVVQTLDDLPVSDKKELRVLQEKVIHILDHEAKERPNDSALVSYIAFQTMQIHSLQKEIHGLHKIALVLAQSIDEKADRKPE